MTAPLGSLSDLSIRDAGVRIRRGELTSSALTAHALSRIAGEDSAIHAFLHVARERALADAERADRELQAGIDRGPLHGIPYALKDIFDTAGIPTTCHSRLLHDNIPASDSAVEEKLRAGGAVLLGKLATYEFAIGGPSLDLPWPLARNPWNLAHLPGGSSSGPAAAVAAGFVRTAMGTDTGGSIRGPAFFCGIVGLKPTYGRVSRRGVYPLAYSLDHCGPLARSVEDAALAMQVVAGFDPLDPGSAEVPVPDFSMRLDEDLQGLRLAYPRALFATARGASPEVVASIDNAVQLLADLGARVEEIAFPDFDLFNACGRLIVAAESYAVHEANLRLRPHEYGQNAYQRLIAGLSVSAADYIGAMRLRRRLSLTVNNQILGRYDAIVTASGLGTAPRFDAIDPAAPPSLNATQSVIFNVTGNPALSLPTGIAANGLPLGIQIAGRAFDESTLFRIGAAFERARGPLPGPPPARPAA